MPGYLEGARCLNAHHDVWVPVYVCMCLCMSLNNPREMLSKAHNGISGSGFDKVTLRSLALRLKCMVEEWVLPLKITKCQCLRSPSFCPIWAPFDQGSGRGCWLCNASSPHWWGLAEQHAMGGAPTAALSSPTSFWGNEVNPVWFHIQEIVILGILLWWGKAQIWRRVGQACFRSTYLMST